MHRRRGRSLRLETSAELAILIQFQAHAWCISWQFSATVEVALNCCGCAREGEAWRIRL